MEDLAVDRRLTLPKQPDWLGATPLSNNRWAVSLFDEMVGLDRNLSIEERHSFPERLDVEPTWRGNPQTRICPATHRVAMASWPQVDVRNIAGPVQEFDVPCGDSSYATDVCFEGNSILFVAPPEDDPPISPYRLMRGDLDSGEAETLAELTCYGLFKTFVRPSFPGIVVVARDGPDYIALDWVEPADRGQRVTSMVDGFDDLNPSGTRFVKSGFTLEFGEWPSLEVAERLDGDRLKSIFPANGESPYVYANFIDENRVCAWNVYAPELAVIDTRSGEVMDGFRAPLDEVVAIAHQDGETLIVGRSEVIVSTDM